MIRRILGAEIDPRLRPLLVVVGLSSIGQFAFFPFFALWALQVLDVPATELGYAFGASSFAAIAGGIVGGRVSDRIGRRPVVIAATAGQAVLPAVLLLPVGALAAYAVLAAMAFLQPFRGTTQRALLADLTTPEERVQAYGSFRVVQNAGAAVGPLAGGALIALDWGVLYAAIAAVYAVSLVHTRRLPDPAPAAAVPQPFLAVFRDRRFALVFAAGLLGWTIYNAFELLLPVVLAETHGYEPELWGPLFAINAVMVVLLQIRITRWTARFAMRARLAGAMLLMGLPYLALEVGAPIALVVAILICIVVGEMVWMPNAEALVTRLAPEGMRGSYLGTMAAASWIGGAIAPAAGLSIRDAAGESVMWLGVAGVAVAAAMLFAAAARAAETRPSEAMREARPILVESGG